MAEVLKVEGRRISAKISGFFKNVANLSDDTTSCTSSDGDNILEKEDGRFFQKVNVCFSRMLYCKMIKHRGTRKCVRFISVLTSVIGLVCVGLYYLPFFQQRFVGGRVVPRTMVDGSSGVNNIDNSASYYFPKHYKSTQYKNNDTEQQVVAEEGSRNQGKFIFRKSHSDSRERKDKDPGVRKWWPSALNF